MSKFPLTNSRRPGHWRSPWRATPTIQTPPLRTADALEHLPVREPQAALSVLVPDFPDEPSPVNLFGVFAGKATNPCFNLKRLHQIRCTDAQPESTP